MRTMWRNDSDVDICEERRALLSMQDWHPRIHGRSAAAIRGGAQTTRRGALARVPLDAKRNAGQNVRFAEFCHLADPAYEIFRAALDTVFDKSGNVRHEHVDRLSAESRLVYLLWIFGGEIDNGGFDQFFANSSGNHAAEVVSGLETIGAADSHRLLLRAMRWFPNSAPATDRQHA